MNQKQTVLIAGATGFVGKELVSHLLRLNYEVKILTRNKKQASKYFSKEVLLLSWPNENEIRNHPVIYKCDVVVNLAGANIGNLRWTKINKLKILNSRIETVHKLQHIVAALPIMPKVWIQASAIGYYGFNTLVPADERSQKGDGFLADVVQQWESALQNETVGEIRKVILRFGIVIDKSGGFLMQMQHAFNLGAAICPGNGLQKMSWIHLTDLVEIIHLSIENQNYTGVINVVTPNPISFCDFSKLLKRHTRALFTIKVPVTVFRFLLGTEKTNEMLLANQEVIPSMLLKHTFSFKYERFEQIF